MSSESEPTMPQDILGDLGESEVPEVSEVSPEPELEPEVSTEEQLEQVKLAILEELQRQEEKKQAEREITWKDKLGEKYQGFETWLQKKSADSKFIGFLTTAAVPGLAIGAVKGLTRTGILAAGMSGGWALVASAAIGGAYGAWRGYQRERKEQYSVEKISGEINEILGSEKSEEWSNENLATAAEILREHFDKGKIVGDATERTGLRTKFLALSSELITRKHASRIAECRKQGIGISDSGMIEELSELIKQRDFIYNELVKKETQQAHFQEKDIAIRKATLKRALWGAGISVAGYFAGELLFGHSEAAAPEDIGEAEVAAAEPAEIPEVELIENFAPEKANFSGGEVEPHDALSIVIDPDNPEYKIDLHNLTEALRQGNPNVSLKDIHLNEIAIEQTDEAGQTITEKITDNSLSIDQYLYAHGIDANYELSNGQTLTEAIKELFEKTNLITQNPEVQEKVLYEILSYPELLNQEGAVNQLIINASTNNTETFVDSVHQNDFVQKHYIEHLGRAVDKETIQNPEIAAKAIQDYTGEHNLDLNNYELSESVKNLLGPSVETGTGGVAPPEQLAPETPKDSSLKKIWEWLSKNYGPYVAGAVLIGIAGLGGACVWAWARESSKKSKDKIMGLKPESSIDKSSDDEGRETEKEEPEEEKKEEEKKEEDKPKEPEKEEKKEVEEKIAPKAERLEEKKEERPQPEFKTGEKVYWQTKEGHQPITIKGVMGQDDKTKEYYYRTTAGLGGTPESEIRRKLD